MITLLILFIIVLVIFGTILTLQRHRAVSKVLTAEDKSLVHVQWHEIQQGLRKGGPANLRQSVIQADNLVDHCLKALGVPGETMGERLRNGAGRFSDINGIWSAHKTRNQVVHEANKELLSFEAKSALGKFEQALKDLGAL